MIEGLWTRIKEDFERQPLAILAQFTSIGCGIALAVGASNAAPSTSSLPILKSGAALPLAGMIFASSALASACRPIFRKSVIAGFFSALVLASMCMLLFSQAASDALVKTTVLDDGKYKGPLVDLSYWATFSVFVSICATSAISRITATWGQAQSDASAKARTVAPIDLLIFATVWGWSLSQGQQKVLGAFVFEQPSSLTAGAK